jgi:hypothetical protein
MSLVEFPLCIRVQHCDYLLLLLQLDSFCLALVLGSTNTVRFIVTRGTRQTFLGRIRVLLFL